MRHMNNFKKRVTTVECCDFFNFSVLSLHDINPRIEIESRFEIERQKAEAKKKSLSPLVYVRIIYLLAQDVNIINI